MYVSFVTVAWRKKQQQKRWLIDNNKVMEFFNVCDRLKIRIQWEVFFLHWQASKYIYIQGKWLRIWEFELIYLCIVRRNASCPLCIGRFGVDLRQHCWRGVSTIDQLFVCFVGSHIDRLPYIKSISLLPCVDHVAPCRFAWLPPSTFNMHSESLAIVLNIVWPTASLLHWTKLRGSTHLPNPLNSHCYGIICSLLFDQ